MLRELKPELLDSLPPDHPDALHNRRDLRLTNLALGSYQWIARVLADGARPTGKVLEIGAGTGELGVYLGRRGIKADGLDFWPRPPGWPADCRWHQADLLSFAGYADYEVIVGNLIFHQFTAGQLATLGRRLRESARLVVASEPVRRRSSQLLFAAIAPLFGANHVSLHDAHVSVAAGFRGDELPQMLELATPRWAFECHDTLLGAYRMTARRV